MTSEDSGGRGQLKLDTVRCGEPWITRSVIFFPIVVNASTESPNLTVLTGNLGKVRADAESWEGRGGVWVCARRHSNTPDKVAPDTLAATGLTGFSFASPALRR
ncbi:hypothetical protein SKAU_G00292410 [Synaphobranchus kaupii]|uniref:Uncharacterized protein n=1 Tax=Synaphobranchus kaupii TaxID=118154 RepID=A0A9Q1EU17_SYNKA|nr:hypothetical protein SKAU_G00292410 [Synaphobranchus kaupii]